MIITLPLTCLVSWSLVPRPHPAYCHLQCEQVLLLLQAKISWVGPGNEVSQTQPGLDLAMGDYNHLHQACIHYCIPSTGVVWCLWNNSANFVYIYLTN